MQEKIQPETGSLTSLEWYDFWLHEPDDRPLAEIWREMDEIEPLTPLPHKKQ